MEGGGGAGSASDGDEFDGAGAGTPGHADKHGRTYRSQGRWKELQAKELEICQTVLGKEHPSTLMIRISIYNLVVIFKGQGRNEEAMVPSCSHRYGHRA